MDAETSMSIDQVSKMAYTRMIKPVKDKKRVFCLLCPVKNKHYSAEGLKQHIKAAHPGASLDFEECLADINKLCVQECKEMLQSFSTHNQVGITFHFS